MAILKLFGAFMGSLKTVLEAILSHLGASMKLDWGFLGHSLSRCGHNLKLSWGCLGLFEELSWEAILQLFGGPTLSR